MPSPGPGLTTPAGLFTKAVTEASAASAQSCTCTWVHSVPGARLHRDPVTTRKTERQGRKRGERDKRLKRPHPQSCVQALSVVQSISCTIYCTDQLNNTKKAIFF